jgi:hypothetical protein
MAMLRVLLIALAMAACQTSGAAKKQARQEQTGKTPDAPAAGGEAVAVAPPPALPSTTVDNGIKLATDVEALVLTCLAADEHVDLYLAEDFFTGGTDEVQTIGTLVFATAQRKEAWSRINVRAARDSDRRWTFASQPLVVDSTAYVDLAAGADSSVTFGDKTRIDLTCTVANVLP